MTYATLEKIVLGGMLTYVGVAASASTDLIPEDFSSKEGRKLFVLIKKLHLAGHNVETGSIMVKSYESDISPEFLKSCTDKIDHSFMFEENCRERIAELQKLSDLRFAYAEMQKLLTGIREHKLPDQITVSSRIRDILQEITVRHDIKNLDYYGDEAKRVLNKRILARQGAIRFGLKPLDNIIYGMGRGQLIIVAARPGVGKSALALIPAVSAAREGERVKIVSIEMSEDEYGERILTMISGVQASAMLGDRALSETEKIDLTNAMIEFSSLPITIDDKSIRLDDLEKSFVQAKAGGKPIRLMIIDHVGLMVSSNPSKDRTKDLAEISRELKQMAKRHDTTILALSQLTREVSKYDRPDARNLRDTGNLEQDADKIIFLWLDKADKHLTHLAVDKNRQGNSENFEDQVDLYFDGSRMSFTELNGSPDYCTKPIVENEPEQYVGLLDELLNYNDQPLF